MKLHTPTSDERIGRFVNISDVLSVLFAAPIAFLLRDTDFTPDGYLNAAAVYCGVAFVSGLLMLFVFHLGRNLSGYVSVRDLYSIVKVGLTTVVLTSFTIFVWTRLYLIGRSIPTFHFLVLCSLLSLGRVIATMRRQRRERRAAPVVQNPDQVLVIGANRLAWFYLDMINSLDHGRIHIVAILDGDPKHLGRSMHGSPVLAPPSELPRVVTEYAVHGVQINRVMIAANRGAGGSEIWEEVETYCHDASISVSFLGDILNIDLNPGEATDDEIPVVADIEPRPYFAFKRVMDFTMALGALIVLTPIIVPVAIGVLADVGWPLVFWQKRDGLRGLPFLVYKFRTLHAPFDRYGRFVPEDQRISNFGNLLRRSRLDEIPQLWNVLIGDMSFIGPRPLLPVDQPSGATKRLAVPPGLTGWAQIHGGKLITAEEKGALDDWYVENASLGVDIRIVLRTLKIVFTGDRRDEARIADVQAGAGTDEPSPVPAERPST